MNYFLADFGLAKQKKETSKMMSVVGTILYSCPEIIKNEPYAEKADIWALGKQKFTLINMHKYLNIYFCTGSIITIL